MMELPPQASSVMQTFQGLTQERKRQIVAHLAQLSDIQGRDSVRTIIRNGGAEGEFVAEIFGRDVPGVRDSPNNKRINPTGMK